MDDIMKKRVSIGIAVACLLIAGVILYTTMSGPGGDTSSNKTVYLVCVNPKCGEITEMTAGKFRDYMAETMKDNPMGPMGMMGPDCGPTIICPVCKELSCYTGEKCEKCGDIFPIDYRRGNDAYKCPKCGYDKYGDAK